MIKNIVLNYCQAVQKGLLRIYRLTHQQWTSFAQSSKNKIAAVKVHALLKETFSKLGNAVAIVAVFMGVGIIVNEPLRLELARSLTPNALLAGTSTDKNDQDQTTTTGMLPVLMGKLQAYQGHTGHDLISPDVLRLPVPSIAPLASQVKDPIDPAAHDTGLLSKTLDQKKVANFMANKYRVEPAQLYQFVSHALVVAKEVNLDPVLLIAIMSIESNFNPNAQSNMGAQGLMQVLTRVHLDKFAPYGGPAAAFKPEANIRVGALILKHFIAQAGSLSGGLRFYVGGAVVGDGGYANKVLHERETLNALLKNTQIKEVPLDFAAESFPKVTTSPKLVTAEKNAVREYVHHYQQDVYESKDLDSVAK